MMCSLFLRVICSVSEGGAHQASATHKVHQLSPVSLPTCQVLLGCLASFCQVLVRLINYSGLCRITASVAAQNSTLSRWRSSQTSPEMETRGLLSSDGDSLLLQIKRDPQMQSAIIRALTGG